METVTDFLFLGSKVTADSDCSHEIKTWLFLGRLAMTSLESVLKKQRYHFNTSQRYMNDHILKAMMFPIVRDGCESWTIGKFESRRIDAFECWC